jgi:hypothetical protein
VADLARVNIRYLADGAVRGRMRELLARGGLSRRQRSLLAAEFAAAPRLARAYDGLADGSLTLAGIRMSGSAPAHLNLLIGEVREGGVFAGIHTALSAAALLVERLSVPLRVVMLDFTSAGNSRERAAAAVERVLGASATVVPREALREAPFGAGDFWLASHWKTAHAAQVACELGLIDPGRVAYLIQDYEPGFSPWSTDSVLAEATYHAGFVPLVNSVPLWRFLGERESLSIDRSQVFAPVFELDRLRSAAKARRPDGVVRVLFYSRPSKHRNLFRLGVSALRATALGLEDGAPVEFLSVGEPHADLELAAGFPLRSLGRLAWDAYFDFLASTDVLLSLQQSPHPSHPPFDAAISGALAVTNDFSGLRGSLHPRISAVPATTSSLTEALLGAIRASTDAAPAGFLPVADDLLGGPLPDAVGVVAGLLRRGA